jgi:hypothetical protein
MAEPLKSPAGLTYMQFVTFFLSIQRLRKAIADDASASEAEDLLFDAISAAEHWVGAHP